MLPQAIPGGALSAMSPQNRQKTYADLKVRDRAYCPFGCQRMKCSDVGYCKHIVGWTDRLQVNEEGVLLMEPRKKRYIRVPNEESGRGKVLKWTGQYFVDGANPEALEPGDVMVDVTTGAHYTDIRRVGPVVGGASLRVYRENPPKREPAVTDNRPLEFDED